MIASRTVGDPGEVFAARCDHGSDAYVAVGVVLQHDRLGPLYAASSHNEATCLRLLEAHRALLDDTCVATDDAEDAEDDDTADQGKTDLARTSRRLLPQLGTPANPTGQAPPGATS